MTVKITDNSTRFAKNVQGSADLVLSRMAIDIERAAKLQVPKDKKRLLQSGRHERKAHLRYEVSFNTKYARYQHEGGDGKRTVRNYTTPGTKSHYLSDPGNAVVKRSMEYIKAEMRRVTA
jgi:hypothetical protein